MASEPRAPDDRSEPVTDEYARAFEAGALAALDWLDENYPGQVPTTFAADHIAVVIDLMLSRTQPPPSPENAA